MLFRNLDQLSIYTSSISSMCVLFGVVDEITLFYEKQERLTLNQV